MADRLTAQRFAQGMSFADYVAFAGSPENLKRQGFDIRRFAHVTPRLDWSGFLKDRHAKAAPTPEQAAAIQWLAKQPGGPAEGGSGSSVAGPRVSKVLMIVEDWSSDVRRDLPYIARLAEAGGLELRIFVRDGETMLMKGLPEPGQSPNADLVQRYANDKNGQRFATVPVAVFFDRDFNELYRYIEYPAIYHKDRLIGHLRTPRAGESDEAMKARAGAAIGALLESPFYDVWARAAVDEILSALHERVILAEGSVGGPPAWGSPRP